MGWFDEQIKLRKERDDDILSDALEDIATVITGENRADSLDDREKIKNSLDEILKFYHLKSREMLPYCQALLLSRFIRGDLDAYPPFMWK